MAAEGSDPASPASAPPPLPLPKRRKIEPPRRTRPSQVTLDKDKSVASSNSSSHFRRFRVRCQRELISTKLERQRDLPSFKRSMRGALAAIKALIPSLGITLFLSSQTNDFFDQVPLRARPDTACDVVRMPPNLQDLDSDKR